MSRVYDKGVSLYQTPQFYDGLIQLTLVNFRLTGGGDIRGGGEEERGGGRGGGAGHKEKRSCLGGEEEVVAQQSREGNAQEGRSFYG